MVSIIQITVWVKAFFQLDGRTREQLGHNNVWVPQPPGVSASFFFLGQQRFGATPENREPVPRFVEELSKIRRMAPDPALELPWWEGGVCLIRRF